MIEYDCEDCGCHVACWPDVDGTRPKLCFLCEWVRDMPEEDRPGLREWLRLNPPEAR